MDLASFIDIPIVVIIYIIVYITRKFIIKNKKYNSLLPILAASLGVVISIVIFTFFPNVSSSTNALQAFTSGFISGMGATGSNQIYKQISRCFSYDSCSDNDD